MRRKETFRSPLGTHQMLSLRSLAFILCSAIRRARALSCAALHCFPDIINARKRGKMATNNARTMATAAPMCSLLTTSIRLPRRSRLGAQRTSYEHRARSYEPNWFVANPAAHFTGSPSTNRRTSVTRMIPPTRSETVTVHGTPAGRSGRRGLASIICLPISS